MTAAPTQEVAPPAAAYAAAAGAILLWGGTAVANRLAVEGIDPLLAGVGRTVVAGAAAAAIAWALALRRPAGMAELRLLAVAALGGFVIWPAFLSYGLARTTAGHAGLIIGILPVVTGLVASAVDRRAPRAGWWLGCAVAAAGVWLLVDRHGLLADGTGDPLGDLIVLCGAVFVASSYVAGARLSARIGMWPATLWTLALGAAAAAPVVAIHAPPFEGPAASWAGFAYLVVGSSFLGYALWFWALGRGGVMRMSVFQFAMPLATLGLAALVLGEPLTPGLLIAATVIVAGTWTAHRYGG